MKTETLKIVPRMWKVYERKGEGFALVSGVCERWLAGGLEHLPVHQPSPMSLGRCENKHLLPQKESVAERTHWFTGGG